MQHADAEDLAQEVLALVGRQTESFQSRGEGSFRAWLFQITRNLVVNHLTRNRGPIGSGDSDVQQMILQQPDVSDQTDTLFRLEYRRVRFQSVAETLRTQFSEPTWLSFWMTAVEGKSIDDVAGQLGKSAGSVRVARCRVLSRLRLEVHDQDPE
jgi:RNA polymerase sigma-70 factor (ECF subfamily)